MTMPGGILSDWRPDWARFNGEGARRAALAGPAGDYPTLGDPRKQGRNQFAVPQLDFQHRVDAAVHAPDERPWYSKVADRLMPVPQALEGLLSQEDIKNARMQGLLGMGASLLESGGPSTERVSLGQALGRGLQAGMGSYQQHLGQSAQLGAANRQQQLEQAKLRSRAEIFQKYPMPANPTPQQTAAWIDSITPELIKNNDVELLGKLGEVRKSIGEKSATPRALEEVRLGNKVQLRDPFTHKVVEELPIGPSPRDPNAPDTAAQLREQRMFDRTNRLADDYRSETKEIAKAADGFRTMTSVAPSARAGSAQAQIALVYAFMHSLDPTSTVREGEYASAKNAAGVPDVVRNQWNKLQDGHFLTPDQVDRMAAAAGQAASGWRQRQKNVMATYKQRAGRWKINPDDVLLDYFDGLPDVGATPAAPASGSGMTGRFGSIR